MKKILIATDGSPSSAEAVEFGVELAEEHEAAVIFVHVAPGSRCCRWPATASAAPWCVYRTR